MWSSSKEQHESNNAILNANKKRKRQQEFNKGPSYYQKMVLYYDGKKHRRYNPDSTDYIKHFDKIDQYTKDLVFGYINISQLSFPHNIDNNYYKIHSNIYILCLLYFNIPFSIESIEYFEKMPDIVNRLEKTDITTRQKIWDKFDKQQIGILNFEKTFPKILYAYIALYIKVKDRKATPPKYSKLEPLCKSVSMDIKRIAILNNNDNCSNGITKNEYEENILNYWKQTIYA